MRLVIFGLTVTSSWGNGHSTLWRGLIKALGQRGWSVTFFEKDVPYYSDTRDRDWLEGGELVLYSDWADIRPRAVAAVAEADAALVSSYCPDGVAAAELICGSRVPLKLFYDLDTPVTLAHLDRGEPVDYLPPGGLGGFDLVLSYTGGRALTELSSRLGARRTAPLYGHVDPDVHRPGTARPEFSADLSYIGTYATDRQQMLERLLVQPARRAADRRFVIAGAQYPADFPWTPNIHFVRHLPAIDHPDFYASSQFTLNVTRADMAAFGWCPSGRLFEAAACGTAILTDTWPGLDDFFVLGDEVLPVDAADGVLVALNISPADRQRLAHRARERVLAEHTSAHRAAELDSMLSSMLADPASRLMEGA